MFGEVLALTLAVVGAFGAPSRHKRQQWGGGGQGGYGGWDPNSPGSWGFQPEQQRWGQEYLPQMGTGGEMPHSNNGQAPPPPPKKGTSGTFRGGPPKNGQSNSPTMGSGGPVSGKPQPTGRGEAVPKAKTKPGKHKCAELDLIWLWPDATMKYEIGSDITSECSTNITEAMETLNYASDNYIKFEVKGASDEDYVLFTSAEAGCTSELGRYGGKQTTNLGVGCCLQGIVMHEILHDLGFNHMHTRTDRDDYVAILTDNIKSAYTANFAKYNASVTLLGNNREYDYNSIMHYPTNGFAKSSGLLTIQLPDGVDDTYVGQRDYPTDTDINILKDVYEKCYQERRKKTGEATVDNSGDSSSSSSSSSSNANSGRPQHPPPHPGPWGYGP